MSELSQSEIQRIVRRELGGYTRSGAGLGAGGVSQAWVQSNFISIEFFNRLFRAHGKEGSTATDIDPNDTDTAVTDIEAKVGFWTQQLVSALGQGEGGGGGGGGSSTLAGLDDVSLSGLAANQMLVFNGAVWANQACPDLSGFAARSYVDQQDAAVKTWASVQFVTPISLAQYVAQNQYYLSVAYASEAGSLSYSGAYTAWGQTFFSNGVPQSISGDMTGVGNITASGTILTENASGADIVTGINSSQQLHLKYDYYENRGLYDTEQAEWLIGCDGTNTFLNLGYVGIGKIAPAYKLDVNGTIHASNIASDSNVTNLSDIRKKRIIADAAPKIEQVATARAVEFEWLEHPESGRKVGSIAQDWQKILPQAVVEREDGMLTLDYSVTALLSAISAAREIVKLKKRIEQLENIIKEKNHG